MKKGLILLFGESFRFGDQGNRVIGSPQSFSEQIKASTSHLKFIEYMKKQQCFINISINSYKTQYSKDLIKVYKEYLVEENLYNNVLGMNNLIKKSRINKIEYDFILYMRVDIFLKEKFFKIFNPNWNKILFPSCGIIKSTPDGHPRVNDMMMFLPKKYHFHLEKFDLSHYTWSSLINSGKFTYNDLDMMINTFHNANTSKDNHPLYYIVNRYQCLNKLNEKDIFNKYDFNTNLKIKT